MPYAHQHTQLWQVCLVPLWESSWIEDFEDLAIQNPTDKKHYL